MNRPEPRFARSEVLVHTSFALLVFLAIGSAALLWFDPLALWIGRRAFISQVHLVAGLLMPLPLALGLLSAHFRRDVQRLERFTADDREWLRSSDRRSGRVPIDRFNAGQKLNAAFTLGAVLVLFGTGMVMGSVLVAWPTDYRIGATWVHGWAAFGMCVAIAGHLYFVWRYRRGDATALSELFSEPLDHGR